MRCMSVGNGCPFGGVPSASRYSEPARDSVAPAGFYAVRLETIFRLEAAAALRDRCFASVARLLACVNGRANNDVLVASAPSRMDGPCRLYWDRCRYRAHLLGRAGARRKGVDACIHGSCAGAADP